MIASRYPTILQCLLEVIVEVIIGQVIQIMEKVLEVASLSTFEGHFRTTIGANYRSFKHCTTRRLDKKTNR